MSRLASEGGIGIVVGLRAEARIARRLGFPVAIGGGTGAGAAIAARALADGGVTALVSFGLAGGLAPGLAAGTLLVPRAFLLDGVRVPANPFLAENLGGTTCDLLLCGSSVIATAEDKTRVHRQTGATGVDLESAAVVRVARERGLAVAALRAICDPAERSLPPAAMVALSVKGGIKGGRVLRSLLRHPGQLPGLVALARDAAAARRALTRRVCAVLPEARWLRSGAAHVGAPTIGLMVALASLPSAAQAQTAHALPGPRQTALCGAAIQRAEQAYRTPPGLLVTIGKVESGRRDADGALEPWPWTINADGQGYFFPSKAEAVDWARRGLTGGVQYMDVGCMQVDLQMHPGAFRSLDEAFDPDANADYAARFLSALRDGAGGNWYTAIGLYHSHTPELAAYYRTAVAAVAAGLPVPGGGPRVGRLAITRVSLSGGGATMLNLRRQPARVRRTMSPCRIAAVLGSYLRSGVAGCKRS